MREVKEAEQSLREDMEQNKQEMLQKFEECNKLMTHAGMIVNTKRKDSKLSKHLERASHGN